MCISSFNVRAYANKISKDKKTAMIRLFLIVCHHPDINNYCMYVGTMYNLERDGIIKTKRPTIPKITNIYIHDK